MAITPQPRGVIELDRTPLFQNTQQLLRRAEAEVRLIDRLKGNPLYSHINLDKGERSELANLASMLL